MGKLWVKNGDERVVFTDDNGNDYFLTKTLMEAVTEEELREEHPALQEAWDRYQVLLKLCEQN